MALVEREDTPEEVQNQEIAQKTDAHPETPPQEEETPKKKSFWSNITMKDVLIYGIIFLGVIGYFAFDNLKGSTFIIADNPTEEGIYTCSMRTD